MQKVMVSLEHPLGRHPADTSDKIRPVGALKRIQQITVMYEIYISMTITSHDVTKHTWDNKVVTYILNSFDIPTRHNLG